MGRSVKRPEGLDSTTQNGCREPRSLPGALGAEPPTRRSRALRRLGLARCLAPVLALALLAGCAMQRQVLSSDVHQHLEVALLSGAPVAEPPADPAFARMTPRQVEESLRRLVVRPAGFTTLSLGEPAPFLSEEQLRWARDAVATLLPTQRPDQRVQLRFLDRFSHYDVEVEIFGEGRNLVYHFTRLSVPPKALSDPMQPFDQHLHYVTLQPQPGQVYAEDGYTFYLRDPVFALAAAAAAPPQLSALAAFEQGAAQRKLPEAELPPARERLAAHPQTSLEAVRTYLDRLQLVLNAQQQGLFSAQEAAQRKARLLDELAPPVAEPKR
jgi:hypothetical protein